MVEIQIGEKKVDITFSKQEEIIKINDERISKELFDEFEEQVLSKKFSESTEEEISNMILEMGEELTKWLDHKDAWLNWKKWATNL
jgi:deoxyhypusine synthase